MTNRKRTTMIRREKMPKKKKKKKKWRLKWMGNKRDIGLCVIFSVTLA